MSTAAKLVVRKTFDGIPTQKINWFPGHMRRARRVITDEMKKVNLFIEVRDSRIPFTSRNDAIHELIPDDMKRIVIFNKLDLANK